MEVEGAGVEAKSFQAGIYPFFKVTLLQESPISAGRREDEDRGVHRAVDRADHGDHVKQRLDGTKYEVVREGEWHLLRVLVELDCLGGGDPDIDGVADPGEGAQVRTRRLSNLRRLIGTKLLERNINKK